MRGARWWGGSRCRVRLSSKSSAKTFNGFQEHCVLDLDSHVTREVVVRPANEPEHDAVVLLAEVLEQKPGLLPLVIDRGYMPAHGWRHGRRDCPVDVTQTGSDKSNE